MSIKGTLKADQLTLAKFSFDRMQGMPAITGVAALTNSGTGETHGYVDLRGVQWSRETKKALDALMLAVEKDVADAHLSGVAAAPSSAADGSSSGMPAPQDGLGEWVDDGNSTPQV